jgi:hypothetical protein
MQRINSNIVEYETWYEFKRELQRRSGVVLLNELWLRIKPKYALPWNESHMREAMIRISGNIMRLKICPRCAGNLLLDKDIDGHYKRCIQCSFEIAIPPGAQIPDRKPSNTASGSTLKDIMKVLSSKI